MTLPVRPLGSSGLNITTVGFGAWAVGGGSWSFGWGPQDDAQSLAAMRRALELGINWIDTAAVYGLGHSEEVVGQLLRGLPASDRPLVFSKCSLVWDPYNRMKPPVLSFDPKSIRRECEASLRRLGVERIDLYQIHQPVTGRTPVEESWETMANLAKEGKIRFAGVSNFNIELLNRCEVVHHVASLQPPFSLINRAAAEKEIPWCEAHSTGVICYSPMQSGLLTDSFKAQRMAELAKDDWRRKGHDFKEPRLRKNLELRDALRPIAQRHGVTVSSVAIAWTLCWPGMTGAIVGARTAAQVDGWIQGASLQLTEEDLMEIASILLRTQAGIGPTHAPKASASTGAHQT